MRATANFAHGLSGYNNYGCRCQVCTEGNTEYQREYRQRRAAEGNLIHGSRDTYVNANCRCRPCTAAASAATKAWARANPEKHRKRNRESNRRARQQAQAMNYADLDHGTWDAYNRSGCRCDQCKAVGRRYTQWKKVHGHVRGFTAAERMRRESTKAADELELEPTIEDLERIECEQA